ncbi:MAG: hypothetical protein NWE98_09820 [Candidatus Bathyarchaeota archaeon]|nr:hypothetical protein [Candidatus Bathyarchaeota archaeon]
MKILKIALIVSLVSLICLSCSVVYALESNELLSTTRFSNDTPNPGDSIYVRVMFESNTDEQLQLQYIGFHFDWMEAEGFIGFNYSSTPISIEPHGTYTTPPLSVKIPTTAAVGAHTFYLGVDGVEGASQTPFSWDSPTGTIAVGGSSATIKPTVKPSNGGGGGTQTSSPLTWLIIGTVIAVVAVVIVMMLLIFKQRRRRAAVPTAAETTSPAETPPATPESAPQATSQEPASTPIPVWEQPPKEDNES